MKPAKDIRQDDFYSKRAKEENYPARSVYKLKEINKKYRIIKPGDSVLDIGCSPGSWMLYLSEKVGRRGNVIGVDLEEPKIILKDNMKFIKKDIRECADFFQKKFDVIVSDAAPGTSGIHFIDVAKSLELAQTSLEIVQKALKLNGNFLCKIFEGEGTDEFLKEIKTLFSVTKPFRPNAVRKHSREFYLIATGFKYGKPKNKNVDVM
ncbi:RlmE family RNA methyltransferase [Patescibacteria group bacterium]|nr:RlmE family RNA methyltransferase [Patescibacteria group bacterium]MBU4022847.1 RlmE family RNA methyltransferase [Patescibacteria group bacterium]